MGRLEKNKYNKKMIVLGVFEMTKHKILKSKLGFNAGHKHFPEYIFSILQGFSTLITLC